MKSKHLNHLVGALLLGGVALCLPNATQAAFMPVGGPQPGNSWIQAFSWLDGSISSIEVFMVADLGGGPLEAPGMDFAVDSDLDGTDDLFTPGWSGSLVSPTYALGTGSGTPEAYFDVHFIGDAAGDPAGVVVDILAWSGAPLTSTLLGASKATFDEFGGLVSLDAIDAGDGSGYGRAPAVPDGGATLGLLGLGTLGLVLLRRKAA